MTRSTPRGPASAQSGPLTRNAAARIRTSASRPQWPVDARDAFDAAVAAAYGWSADVSDDEVLRELLALNGGGR